MRMLPGNFFEGFGILIDPFRQFDGATVSIKAFVNVICNEKMKIIDRMGRRFLLI